jgi:hypothetical protein
VQEPTRKRIGELLIERGKLDAVALERALRMQQESGGKLGTMLVTLGLCAQRDVTEALAAQLGLPVLDAASYPELPILEERVSARLRCRCARTTTSSRWRCPILPTRTRSRRSKW